MDQKQNQMIDVTIKPFNQHFVLPLKKFYDDVVDKTDFKKGSDTARNKRLGDTGGSLGDGLYDFGENDKVDSSKVSAIDLALRTGSLDRADIDTLKRKLEEGAKLESEQNLKKKAQEEKEKLDEARQSFLDKQTGFDPNSVQEDSK